MPHDENVAFALFMLQIRNSIKKLRSLFWTKWSVLQAKNVKSTFLAWCDVLSGQYLVAQEKLFFVLDGMPKFILASIVLGYLFISKYLYRCACIL